MKDAFRGIHIDRNKEQVLSELLYLQEIINIKKIIGLQISDLTSKLIINITETKDADILDLANRVSESFLNEINKSIDEFPEEQLPTIFAVLQLFAVEAGQYDFEITENPDTEINRLTEKYDKDLYHKELLLNKL